MRSLSILSFFSTFVLHLKKLLFFLDDSILFKLDTFIKNILKLLMIKKKLDRKKVQKLFPASRFCLFLILTLRQTLSKRTIALLHHTCPKKSRDVYLLAQPLRLAILMRKKFIDCKKQKSKLTVFQSA